MSLTYVRILSGNLEEGGNKNGSNVQHAINNEWKCMEISHTRWQVQGEIMRKVKLWPLLPCCFVMSTKRLRGILFLRRASKQGIVFISLSVLKTSGTDDWDVAGGCRCISEEFKEINRIWGSEVAGKNTPISRRTILKISSHTQRSNLWETVSSLSFVNKLSVFTVWAVCTHWQSSFKRICS